MDDNSEELRIALVMTGGVSLAVWIGGVTHEINRLVQAHDKDGVYAQLLNFTETTARVDVISGASAGGINGALLALAQVYGADLKPLRTVWLDKAGLRDMLRSPFSAELPSLLDGNDYFLKHLEKAFTDLARNKEARPPDQVPIDLTMTATLLHGQATHMSDDLGAVITDSQHRARFRFRRGPDLVGIPDPFAKAGDATRRLALAARATASFPIAFEPVLCWASRGAGSNQSDLPDMQGLLDASGAGLTGGRFLLDGGILDNKPIESALEAIFAQRGDRSTRRVVAYVAPDPGETVQETANPAGPPSVGEVAFASLFKLPLAESISDQLRQIRDHNLTVEQRRNVRINLITNLEPEEIEDLAETLFSVYRQHRTQGAVDYIVSELDEGFRQASDNLRGLGRQSRDLLRQTLETCDFPRWLPSASIRSQASDQISVEHWAWGLYTVEYFSQVMLAVTRRAQDLVPRNDGRLRTGLKTAWSDAYDLLLHVRELRKRGTQSWRSQARGLTEILRASAAAAGGSQLRDRLGDWACAVARGPESGEYEFGESTGVPLPDQRQRRPHTCSLQEAQGWLAHQIVEVIRRAAPVLRDIAAMSAGAERSRERKAAKELQRYVDFLCPEANSDHDAVLCRLLALDVVTYSVGSHARVPDQLVDLVQISANTPEIPGPPSNLPFVFGAGLSAKEKLAGLQLGHFGAFYKKSWRANDWMFGRLDGAARLVQIVLHPARLHKLYGRGSPGAATNPARHVVEQIMKPLAVGPVTVGNLQPSARVQLESLWARGEPQLLQELDFLNDVDPLIPDALPLCAAAVAQRIQFEILAEELPVLAAAVEDDIGQGSDRLDRPGTAFLAAMRRELGGSLDTQRPLTGEQIMRLFEGCEVRRERIEGEIGSDLFTHTVTKAFAVTVSAGAGAKSGLGALRWLFGSARAPAIVLYVFTQNLLRQSQTGAIINTAVTVFGATLVGLYLMGAVNKSDAPNFLLPVGAVLLVAGLALSIIRYPRVFLAGLSLVVLVLALILPAEIKSRLCPVALFVTAAVLLAVVRIPRWVARLSAWLARPLAKAASQVSLPHRHGPRTGGKRGAA
jgi:patatin-related protein